MRRVALATVAATTLATPAAARFAPPLDMPLRVETVQLRDEGEGPRRFAVAHDLIFARAGDGYRATLTLRGDSVADSGDTLGAFARLHGALAGRPVTVVLDHSGRIVSVADLDALWARLRAAIAQVASGTPARDRTRAMLLAHHDAATTEQRVDTVAGTLAGLCAGAEAERRTGTRATALPSTFGDAAARLPARETVTREGGIIRVVLTAAGPIPGPAATQARVTVTRTREIARGTGLVRRSREVRETVLGIAGKELRMRADTEVRIAMVSGYPSPTPPKP